MKISEITRRDVVDAILVQKVNWAGRLEEPEFLSRLFDLNSLSSTDGRFSNAAGDIHQHRINNYDWEDHWVFYDERFNLLNGDDEIFLNFLCETIHPVVRSDVVEAESLRQLYNEYLKNDGFQLVEKTRISGKPIYVGRYVGITGTPGVSVAKESFSGADLTYVSQQITRMEAAIAYSSPSRPPIIAQAGHPLSSMPATHSGLCRPLFRAG